MILILAEPADRLTVDLMARLAQSGSAVFRAGPDNWNELRLSWELPTSEILGHVICGDRRLALGELSGVLVRALPSVPVLGSNETDDEYLLMEWSAALSGFLCALPCPVINRPRPGRHFRQPVLWSFAPQLEKAGMRLPDMLVTQSPEEAHVFLQRNAATIAVPPRSDSRPADGAARKVPVCLIAVPEGPRRRIAVVGHRTFGEAAIPEQLALRCVTALREMGLEFAVLDLVSNPQGDWLVEFAEYPNLDDWPAAVRETIIAALAASLNGCAA